MSFIEENFLLTNEQAIRLYHEFAENKPILDFHNHLPPKEIAYDRRFENLAQIWLESDHYKWRAMRANGTPEELITGNGEPVDKFFAFASTLPHALGNPLYHWTHLELKRCFGIDLLLGPDTAEEIWSQANEQLKGTEFSALGMLKKFQVHALCTTDDPAESTEYHRKIKENPDITCRVLPTFRPDQAWAINDAVGFFNWVENLARETDKEIESLTDFLEALAKRINQFHSLGARMSDHSFHYFFSDFPSEEEARVLFLDTLAGQSATRVETERFGAFILLYLSRLYSAKEWTMQIHLGPLRNNSTRLMRSFGPDAGADSIGDWSQAERMSRFFDKLDRENSLPKTIVYNNNPADNFTIATMLGNFQRDLPGKLQMGTAWWHLDQKDGIEEQLKTFANVGLLSHFLGMLTDSRSFLSFPRHEYYRRILCNLMGTWMKEGIIPEDFDLSGSLINRVCHDNARSFLKLMET